MKNILILILISTFLIGCQTTTHKVKEEQKGAGKMGAEFELTIEEALAIKDAVLRYIRKSESKEIRLLEGTIVSEKPEFIEVVNEKEIDFYEPPILVLGLWIFDKKTLTLTKRVEPGHSKGIEYIAKLKRIDGIWEVESIRKRSVRFKWK